MGSTVWGKVTEKAAVRKGNSRAVLTNEEQGTLDF